MLSIGLYTGFTFSTLLVNFASAQTGTYAVNTATEVNSTVNDTNIEYSEALLAQMLAPIALYPDSLLTHILIASTYPIEIVEADRWITKNENLSATEVAQNLEEKDWEPSVKALVMFPKILKRLSDDLSWTQQLGDAFLESEENVLQAIQTLRYQADNAGSLDQMENVNVSRDDNNIIIQPIQKEVVYVPYYDTRHVYGNWHWPLRPPIFWDWGYQARYSHHKPFSWHRGIHISLDFFFSAFHWSNRNVVVVNHRNTRHYGTQKNIIQSGYAKRWAHNPYHRRGVSYRSKQVNKRYTRNRSVVYKTVNSAARKRNANDKYYSHTNRQHTYKKTKHETLKNKFKTHKNLTRYKEVRQAERKQNVVKDKTVKPLAQKFKQVKVTQKTVSRNSNSTQERRSYASSNYKKKYQSKRQTAHQNRKITSHQTRVKRQ